MVVHEIVQAQFVKDTYSLTLRALLEEGHAHTLLRVQLGEESSCVLGQDGICKL